MEDDEMEKKFENVKVIEFATPMTVRLVGDKLMVSSSEGSSSTKDL